MKRRLLRSDAFTLIEVLMAITLVGILSIASIGLYDSSLDDAKFDATYKEMLQLRKAVLGDLENTTVEGQRIRFGYLGDVGSIPSTAQGLGALYSLPTGLSVWAIDSSSKLGVGWNGPYLISANSSNFGKDSWGRSYVYNSTATVPYILSYGADGALGGTGTAQDIQIDLPLSIRTATVYGQITTSGAVYPGAAVVTIYYPSAGATTSQSATLAASAQGQFSFSNIPFGVRTIKVQIPDGVSPVITLGPVSFAVDNQNFVIPASLLEVNPLMSDSNCNTIANVSYVAGSMVNDTSQNEVSFKLNVNRSFATKAIYTTNDLVHGGTTSQLEQIGIGGVVYGCTGLLNLILYGGGTRQFTQCERQCILMFGDSCFLNLYNELGYVTLNSNPNLTLNATWGIPAGSEMQGFMRFNNSTSSMDWIDMRLGCDLIRIQ